jgi:hypothetical protein
MAAHTSNDNSNNKTSYAMSSSEGERITRITSHRWLQEYKKEFRHTPAIAAGAAVFSDGSFGDARIPSMDPALRIGSSFFDSYRSAMSTQIAVEEPVSTQDLITASLLAHEIDAQSINTCDFVTSALLRDDAQTETPHLFPEQADKQAVEPLKLPPTAREYVDTVGECDILSERGGKANHHSGNKRYRKVVSEIRAMYRDTADKKAKTDLSKAILEYVDSYGGRFLKKDREGRYFIMTRAEARKKTSQALRETKELKWTDVDMEDDVQVEEKLLASRMVKQGDYL